MDVSLHYLRGDGLTCGCFKYSLRMFRGRCDVRVGCTVKYCSENYNIFSLLKRKCNCFMSKLKMNYIGKDIHFWKEIG